MELSPIQIINVENAAGKNFLAEIDKLLITSNKNNKNLQGEKLKIMKTFMGNEIPSFFGEILKTEDKELQAIYKDLKMKRVSVCTFGRKVGYMHKALNTKDIEVTDKKGQKRQEDEEGENKHKIYFRFMVHLGSPEAYYVSNSNMHEKPYALKSGYGFVISPLQVENTSFTVYNNHIRLINDPKVQSEISKIRPADYRRTVLIYDLEFDMPIPTSQEEVEEASKIEKTKEEIPELN